MLGERLTRPAGSSDYFRGGAIPQDDGLKPALLDVPPALLAAHGAVSELVGGAMAEGARDRFGADYGVAVTGIAGPGGGSEAKPVGTVHLAIAGPPAAPGEPATDHRRLRFPGDRERIRWQATQIALDMLRRRLLAAAAAGSRPGPAAAPAAVGRGAGPAPGPAESAGGSGARGAP